SSTPVIATSCFYTLSLHDALPICLLFAYGRRGTIYSRFGAVHKKFLTPSVAVLGITAGTLVGLFLCDALLVPVTEVGSMASALGDRKSTRLNSSHEWISYAVFCLK